MKLHLPVSLLSALLACLTLTTSPDARAAEYTWLGGGTSADITAAANWSPTSSGAGPWSGTAKNTMLFSQASNATAHKSLIISYNSFSLAGMTVEAGVTGFSLKTNTNNDRTANLRAISADESILFNINEDFSFGLAGSSWAAVAFHNDAQFNIAAGKTMNIHSGLANGEGVTDAKTITVGSEGYSGTLVLNAAAKSAATTGMTNNRNYLPMISNWVVCGGAMVELKNATALGTGTVLLDGGRLKTVDGKISNAITINGNSGMTVTAASQFSNVSLSNAVQLNMNTGTLSIAQGGRLGLGTSGTVTGNLSLGASSLLNFSELPAAGSQLLTVTGSLTLNGTLLLNSDVLTNISWTAGSYDLVSATTISGSLTNSFILDDQHLGSWKTVNGKLTLVVEESALMTWKGGDGTWQAGGSAADSPWAGGGIYSDASAVIFGDIAGNATQTVTLVGSLDPKVLEVSAKDTDYIWTGEGSLTGDTKLQKQEQAS